MADPQAVADAAARERALDPAGSFIVQAPAGSGKTELLTQRYLRLLAGVAAPEEIVAITFTRKAVSEMLNRILGALERARTAPAPEAPHERRTWELACAVVARDRERGWGLADAPTRLRMQTIDSLCATLTRQMPLLARFGVPPAIAEDASALYQAAARGTLALLEGGNDWSPAVAALLDHLDNQLPVAEALLAEMLARRDQWLRHVAAGRSGRGQLRAVLEQGLANLIGDALAGVRAAVPGEAVPELLALVTYALEHLPAGGETALEACRGLVGLPGTGPRDGPAWAGLAELLLTGSGTWRRQVNQALGFPAPSATRDPAAKQHYQEMKQRHAALIARLEREPALRERLDQLRRLPPPRYGDPQWTILEALLELLPLAVAQLYLVFRGRGQVDYTEVAQGAVLALGEAEAPTDLALALDYRIQHLLVDEFQDTSLSQFELLERLTAGWQPGDGRTLFLVGDPMQSIYRFREAEVGLYLRARHEGLGGVTLTPLTLSVNFRSQRGVVEWVNETFAQVLPAEEDIATGAVPYSPATAFHPSGASPAVTVHPLIGPDSRAEAALIGRLVAEARRRSPAGRLAILVRARTHLPEIVQVLKAAGLRYRAIEIEQLGERPVVQDLLALTHALVHPADRAAWLAVLRAPWCGLTLADLHALAGEDAAGTVWELMHDAGCCARLGHDGRQRLERLRAVLAVSLAQRRRARLRRWIEGTWLALGGPACVEDATDLEDAAVYLDLLDTLEQGADLADLAELRQRVGRLYALPDTEAQDTLQVMTIHKAKGLEFDTVIVPGLGRLPGRDRDRLLLWLERARGRDGVDLLLAPITPRGAPRDPIYAYISELDQQKTRHEEGRLLYVAATRARERLHLVGHIPARGEDGRPVPPRSGTLLSLLWPVAAPVFEAGAREEPAAAQADAPRAGALCRLAGDWQRPPPPPAVEWGRGKERPAPVEEPVAIDFEWASESIRHVGTVVHRLLQQIARTGAAGWDRSRIAALRPAYERLLARLGVPAAALAAAVERVEQALAQTLEDERGRWILDGAHREARCEYPLTGEHGGRVVRVVIDRTFVDADGVCWIIDYKTGSHTGGGREAFLDRERERYRPQLERYAALLARQEKRPMRLGLYFPLLGGWREWGV